MVDVRRIMDSTAAGLVVALAVLFTMGLTVFNSVVARDYSKCVAQYTEQYSTAAQQRSALASQQQGSVTKVILAVARSESREETRAALNIFVQEQDQIAQERAEHPIPDPPSEVCH